MTSCFMKDCDDNERLALDIVFPHIPVFLCIDHVQKAWTKKLIEVVSGHEKRAIMNAALEDLCFGSTLTIDGEEFDVERYATMKLLLFFKNFQLSEPQFVYYFQTEWKPCLSKCKFVTCASYLEFLHFESRFLLNDLPQVHLTYYF